MLPPTLHLQFVVWKNIMRTEGNGIKKAGAIFKQIMAE